MIAPELFACSRHWYMLLPSLRSAINRAWARYCAHPTNDNRQAHEAAKRAAIEYLAGLLPATPLPVADQP